MIHARLGIAEENSGKLVSLVRKEARQLAEQCGADLIITDGPPGIGCPVIASIGGATALVIVVEPTVSGIHDMERVVQLAAHFKVPGMVCMVPIAPFGLTAFGFPRDSCHFTASRSVSKPASAAGVLPLACGADSCGSPHHLSGRDSQHPRGG